MLFGAQPKELTKALAFYGAAAPAGGTAGVFLGGVLTDVLSWEWVFLINIPIALIALAATPRLMPAAQAGRGSVDIAGAVTVTAGLAAAVFAIVRAPEEGWGSTVTIAVLAGAVVLLASFLVIQSKRKTPLVRLSIFRTPNLGAANVAQLLLGAAWIPMSASAWRTRLRSVSGCIPRSRGDGGDRPAALQRQPHTALDQLIGVLLRSGHNECFLSGGPKSSFGSLRQTQPACVNTNAEGAAM